MYMLSDERRTLKTSKEPKEPKRVCLLTLKLKGGQNHGSYQVEWCKAGF